jgi:large subunit ribosomal protein L4
MPKVATYNATGAQTGEIELPESIFGLRLHKPVLHQALVAELANRRAGTHATKTRGQVRGGGRKPWRQKGTGRARQGSRRSPIWTGGGITFGPQPRSYSQTLSRRDRALALRSALSAQAQAGKIVVIDLPSGERAKTKTMAALLLAVGGGERSIVVSSDAERGVARAAVNVRGTRVVSAKRLSVGPLLIPGTVVITRGALAELQEALGS